jgi:pyruvate-ferredoxin/flavodoxin oxidoreductase
VNKRGQGPTWGNSLFEDNAEYGLGIYTAFAHRREELKNLVIDILKRPDLSKDFRTAFEDWLSVYLNGEKSVPASNLINDLFAQQTPAFLDPIKARKDLFVKPAVWIVGGDGWANDIGFGGVDHILASGADVKILVYDNESYANTGFQMSKSTPRGAVMKFAATGKDKPKKNLTQMMLQYPAVYVANCVIAADPKQTLRALKEAESHFGSAFINAYCPCIGHGIRPTMQLGHRQAKLAVESGYYPLFRRDPNVAK